MLRLGAEAELQPVLVLAGIDRADKPDEAVILDRAPALDRQIELGIRSIPTLMVFKGGKLAGQKVGAAPKGDLSRWIQQASA